MRQGTKYSPSRYRPSVPTMAGFSLVEFMVASTVSLILLAAVMALFLNSNTTYRVNESVARLQENGRYALDELSYDLQLAGYWGGNNSPELIRRRSGQSDQLNKATNDCTDRWHIELDRPVEGLNNTNSPYNGGSGCIPDSAYSSGQGGGGTDVLVVRRVDPTPLENADLQDHWTYIRSNVNEGELFVGKIASTVGPDPEVDLLPDPALVAKNYALRAAAYYVSNYTNAAGDGRPSLRRATLGIGSSGPAVTTPGELVIDGVQDMQIQFGVDTDNDGSVNQFVHPHRVTVVADWDAVRAVRIWLLVRAIDQEPGYTDTATYNLAGTVVGPFNDGFRRALLSKTVRLRNWGTGGF